jgi:BirA family transcriptional regulator, biotin operon repressor / biotin---[acetyl-CoA-carboxylase] ligase
MPTKKDVLYILENERERFVSGQELAEKLNISRTAVWKAVKSLEEDGHKILAVTNKGYKLDKGSDMLTEEGIRMYMSESMKEAPIIVMQTTDSTNTQAKKLALDKAVNGTILTAEEQTAGRGRSGKSFFSPPGAGLYMSIILKPDKNISDPQMITVAAAVSVCKAIEKLTEKHPQIKWVNDIYLDGKKICGILTEAVTDFESGGIESIVVGIGVDCAITEEMLPEELHGIVGSLEVSELSRNRLAAEIATGVFESFGKLGDNEIINEYRKRSMMPGREISFERGGKRLLADVTGINDMGNLLVRLKTGENLVLNSGEISIGNITI